MPLVSIITTAYKHQNFIAQTIESVLSQTVNDWELLIGDDSPDDATWDIIQNYVSKYPSKIKARHHNPNKWIVDNMNFLLDKVSKESQYIAFLEGDDMYVSDNIKKKLHIFSLYQDLALVYSDISIIDANSKVLFWSWFAKAKKSFLRNEIPWWFFTIMSYSTRMIKKNILLEVWWIPKVPWLVDSNSDQLLCFLVGKKYAVYWINEPLTLYRRHGNNVSENYYTMLNSFLGQIEYIYIQWIVDQKMYQQMKQKTLLDLVPIYLMDKEWKKWWETFSKSMKLWYIRRNIKVLIIVFALLMMPIFLSSYLLQRYKKHYSFFA